MVLSFHGLYRRKLYHTIIPTKTKTSLHLDIFSYFHRFYYIYFWGKRENVSPVCQLSLACLPSLKKHQLWGRRALTAARDFIKLMLKDEIQSRMFFISNTVTTIKTHKKWNISVFFFLKVKYLWIIKQSYFKSFAKVV